MLWQKKKKRKKATKSKAVTQTAPHQPAEELPQTTEPEKKEETPMTDNDDKENYWFTPMYYSNVWVLRRIFGGR